MSAGGPEPSAALVDRPVRRWIPGERWGSMRFIVIHWRLLVRVLYGEMRARFAGSHIGAGWVFLAPLLLLSVYALIYVEIFKVDVPTLSTAGYVLFIFSGLVPFLTLAESLSASLGSVLSNTAVFSNTVYPIDLTPVTAVLVCQGTMVVGVTVILGGGVIFGLLTPFILLTPVVWFLQILALVGIAWILSLVNVLVRDVQNIVSIVLLLLLISSPIAFTPDQVPESIKIMLYVNPVAWFITAYQDVMVLGFSPAPEHWAGLVVFSVGLFCLGSWVFARLKPVAADYV